MLDFLVDNFSAGWVVLLVSLIPMLESKVAIPLGLSVQIWGDGVLSPPFCFVLSVIGGCIPVFIVVLICRRIKKRMSGFVYDKFLSKVEKRYSNNIKKLGQKNSEFKKCVALALFVAVPLPLTGVYSGSIIAGFSTLNVWKAVLSVCIGYVFSCMFVLCLSTLFENSAFITLFLSIGLVALFVLINLVNILFKKIRLKKEKR